MISVVVCNAQNTCEHCRNLLKTAKNVYRTKGKEVARKSFERVYNCKCESVVKDAKKWWADQEKPSPKQTPKTKKPIAKNSKYQTETSKESFDAFLHLQMSPNLERTFLCRLFR